MITLVPMTEAEYLAYLEEAIPDYATDKVACGQWTQEEALSSSKKSFEELLPQGRETAGHHLFTLHHGELGALGMLWFAEQERVGSRVAYIYNIRIDPKHRRKGYATQAFRELEDKVRALGLSGVALHVFGHNTAAQALYAKLGYLPTNINMFKPL